MQSNFSTLQIYELCDAILKANCHFIQAKKIKQGTLFNRCLENLINDSLKTFEDRERLKKSLQLAFYLATGKHVFGIIRVLYFLCVAYPGYAGHGALLVINSCFFNKFVPACQFPKAF